MITINDLKLRNKHMDSFNSNDLVEKALRL